MITIGFLSVIILQVIMVIQLSEITKHLIGLKIFLNKRIRRLDDG